MSVEAGWVSVLRLFRSPEEAQCREAARIRSDPADEELSGGQPETMSGVT